MSWDHFVEFKHRDGFSGYSYHSLLPSSSPSYPPPLPYHKQSTPSASSGNKISPAVLFIIIIIAVIFFISGLLHLLVRFLSKHGSSSSVSESSRYPEMSGSEAFQRQLQQLFHLHDSGLDQAFIDALPVFNYKEIMGLKEPFDCAVCLCEFSESDKLRLLPMCSHAFHIDCIDTWLLSNSTCPLCRGTLLTPGFPIENPVFDFDDPREVEEGLSSHGESVVSVGSKPAANEITCGRRVFSVRLGKFRSSNVGAPTITRREDETSSSNLNARRCYSMGSFQYVVADSELQVSWQPSRGSITNSRARVKVRVGQHWNSPTNGDDEGKKIKSKGESFSVSKIWQWSKKGKITSPCDARLSSSPLSFGLPWADSHTRTQG